MESHKMQSAKYWTSLVALTLTACATSVQTSTFLTIKATEINQPTATLTLTPTLTSTATPTLTPVPSSTPTPSFPVRAGTPFPIYISDSMPIISLENVNNLKILAEYTGAGRALRTLEFQENETIIFQETLGGPACILSLSDGLTTCFANSILGGDGSIYQYEVSENTVSILATSNTGGSRSFSVDFHSPYIGLDILDIHHDLLFYNEYSTNYSNLYLRNLKENRTIAMWEESTLGDLVFSADRNYAAFCADRAWNTDPNDKLVYIDLSQAKIVWEKTLNCAYAGLAFSTDGNLLALQNYQDLIVIDVELQQVKSRFGDICTFQDAYTFQDSHAFSHDNSLLAIACHDWTLQFIDPQTGEVISNLLLPPERYLARRITFSPNGKYLATTSSDGVILIWGILP